MDTNGPSEGELGRKSSLGEGKSGVHFGYVGFEAPWRHLGGDAL